MNDSSPWMDGYNQGVEEATAEINRLEAELASWRQATQSPIYATLRMKRLALLEGG